MEYLQEIQLFLFSSGRIFRVIFNLEPIFSETENKKKKLGKNQYQMFGKNFRHRISVRFLLLFNKLVESFDSVMFNVSSMELVTPLIS